jgi:3-isopropylmalate/(R)-2-methylmalate dehydratase small subunit
MQVIRGRVWKFGDDINTDVITPGKYLSGPIEEVLGHVLEAVNPEFAKEVQKGDILVGGKNFGCGSSRESAPAALKALGLGAVVAESFARIFFRNTIAVGLPALVCPSVSQSFRDGEVLELDLEKAEIRNATSGTSVKGHTLPEEMIAVLNKGGIVALLKEQFGKAEA